MILCNSHGLQLIFKDLLQRPAIKKAWSLASSTVNGLQNSPKQLAYLYEEQEKAYKVTGRHWWHQLLHDGAHSIIYSSQSTTQKKLFAALHFATTLNSD